MGVNRTELLRRYEFENPAGATLDLHDGERYLVLGVDGDGLPPVTLHARRAPEQTGTTTIAVRATPRTLTLLMLILGRGIEDLEERQATLADHCDPTLGMGAPGSRYREGVLRIAKADGSVRALACHAVSGLDYAADALDGAWTRKLALTFEAPDPAFFDPVATLVRFSGRGGGLTLPSALPWRFRTAGPVLHQPYRLRYTGRVEAAPLLTIDGPVTAPVFMNVTTGEALRFTGNGFAVPAGSRLTVDSRFGEKTAQVAPLAEAGHALNALPALAGDSQFWALGRGVNEILITAEGPLAGGVAVLRYHTRFNRL